MHIYKCYYNTIKYEIKPTYTTTGNSFSYIKYFPDIRFSDYSFIYKKKGSPSDFIERKKSDGVQAHRAFMHVHTYIKHQYTKLPSKYVSERR